MDKNEKINELARRRGFLWPAFELYGGAAGFFDYGPLGAPLKRRIEDIWRQYFVIQEGFAEIEAPTIGVEGIYQASGHLSGFSDPLTGCKECKEVYRADHLIKHIVEVPDALSNEEIYKTIQENEIGCPECGGQLTEVYEFNLMFKTMIGPGNKMTGYMRPETAQGMFINFPRLLRYFRDSLPFAAVQIGKSYRNEISPRQGVIRLREFTQAAEFNVLQEPFWNNHYSINIHPFGAQSCTPLSFSPYANSGYQSSAFSSESNDTKAQIQIVSFNMSGLNLNNNNATCSSFSSTSTPGKVSMFLENQMMGNVSLFSQGSFYLLDRGNTGILAMYQNSTSKFIVNAENGVIRLRSLQDICVQGCSTTCYEGYLVKSVPVSPSSLNVTSPKGCIRGSGNITIQEDGCYFGSQGNDIFNVTSTSAYISGRGGNDTFVVTALTNSTSTITINNFKPGDIIDLSAINDITSLNDLHISTQPVDTTNVGLPGGKVLTLLNVNSENLHDGNFRISSNAAQGEGSSNTTLSNESIVNTTANNESSGVLSNSSNSSVSEAGSKTNDSNGSNNALWGLAAIPAALGGILIGAGACVAGVAAYYKHAQGKAATPDDIGQEGTHSPNSPSYRGGMEVDHAFGVRHDDMYGGGGLNVGPGGGGGSSSIPIPQGTSLLHAKVKPAVDTHASDLVSDPTPVPQIYEAPHEISLGGAGAQFIPLTEPAGYHPHLLGETTSEELRIAP